MYEIKFTRNSRKELRKLEKGVASRIINKLELYSSQNNPLSFAKPLANLSPNTHRFRIGAYRATFFIENKEIIITSVQHRKNIYK